MTRGRNINLCSTYLPFIGWPPHVPQLGIKQETLAYMNNILSNWPTEPGQEKWSWYGNSWLFEPLLTSGAEDHRGARGTVLSQMHILSLWRWCSQAEKAQCESQSFLPTWPSPWQPWLPGGEFYHTSWLLCPVSAD